MEITRFWKSSAPVLMEMLRWSLSALGISSLWSDKLKMSPDVTGKKAESKERCCLILGSKLVFLWGAPLSSSVRSLIIKKHLRRLLSSVQAGFYLLQTWAPFLVQWSIWGMLKCFWLHICLLETCLHWEKPYEQLWMLKHYFFLFPSSRVFSSYFWKWGSN